MKRNWGSQTKNGHMQSLANSQHQQLCRLESFYIFDSNTLAKRAKVPYCEPEELFVVSPSSGQVSLCIPLFLSLIFAPMQFACGTLTWKTSPFPMCDT